MSTVTTLFLWLFVAVAVVNLGFCYGTTGRWTNGTTHQTKCIRSEREALLEFKKHLKDPSDHLATWAAGDADCCSWYGVSCHHHDSTAQYVTGLHLRSLCLDDGWGPYERSVFGGKISSALLNLKHLRYMDLSCNDFGGVRIPSFLGSMGSLRYLNLSNSWFGGMIPHQLGNLSNLQYLDLHNDYRYDYRYYPSFVENLHWLPGVSSLKFLDLSRVNLSKVVKVNEVLTVLPSLIELHLSDCQLASPQPPLLSNVNASSLKALISLHLERNDLEGPIPRELQNMSSLSELYLGVNGFNSSIPNWLYGLTRLEHLDLDCNHLEGKISSAIGNLASLITLDLSEQLGRELELEGGIPMSFRNLCNLKELILSGVSLKQDIDQVFEIPSSSSPHSRLEVLRLYRCQLLGDLASINQHLGQMISLESLDISDNSLNGTLPVSLGGLRICGT